MATKTDRATDPNVWAKIAWLVSIGSLGTYVLAPIAILESPTAMGTLYALPGAFIGYWIYVDGFRKYGNWPALHVVLALVSPIFWLASAPIYIFYSKGILLGTKHILATLLKITIALILLIALMFLVEQ